MLTVRWHLRYRDNHVATQTPYETAKGIEATQASPCQRWRD